MIRYLGYRLAAVAAPRLPRSFGYRLFGALGDLAHVTARRTRALVAGNLRTVAPDADEEQLARLSRLAFRNLLWNYYELFRVPTTRPADISAAASIEGIEQLAQARVTGSGAIIVFGHVGNLEVLAQCALLYPDLRFVVVIEHMPDERIFQLMRRLRASQGLTLIRADEPRRLVNMLRDGWNVILAGDFDSTGTGTVVNFFGRPARMPHGAVKLALRTGAPLMVAQGWRDDMMQPDQFSVRLSPPLQFDGADLHAGMAQLMSVLEQAVASRPEQWLAFRKVWLDG
jgi:phosphatidylinositol dimannoside acyltransferase